MQLTAVVSSSGSYRQRAVLNTGVIVIEVAAGEG